MRIKKIVRVDLYDAIDNYIEGFLEVLEGLVFQDETAEYKVSHRLYEMSYRVVGADSGMVLIEVGGVIKYLE